MAHGSIAHAYAYTYAYAYAYTYARQLGWVCDNPSLQVDGDSVEMCYMEDDIITISMIALPALVEAQFEPDGEWVLSQANVEGCNFEKVQYHRMPSSGMVYT